MFPASKNNWRPTASLQNLKARAQLLTQLRLFFAQRDVLEVSTPILASAGVTDPFIDNFVTQFDYSPSGKTQSLFLQTSPEYAMKRLMAAGCEHIYQIAPAFRNEAVGRHHNPEFHMIEWYRAGFQMQDLVNEVIALIKIVLELPNVEQVSYQQVFITYLDIDPLTISFDTLCALAQKHDIELHSGVQDKDDVLQLLFATKIEPYFSNLQPYVVTHFPASQASLATLNESDNRVAERFEVYFKGIELANGFHELTDPKIQAQRFQNDIVKRHAIGKPEPLIDEYFLSALESGLPECSGVAMGLERLLMLKIGAQNISDVMAFTAQNA